MKSWQISIKVVQNKMRRSKINKYCRFFAAPWRLAPILLWGAMIKGRGHIQLYITNIHGIKNPLILRIFYFIRAWAHPAIPPSHVFGPGSCGLPIRSVLRTGCYRIHPPYPLRKGSFEFRVLSLEFWVSSLEFWVLSLESWVLSLEIRVLSLIFAQDKESK